MRSPSLAPRLSILTLTLALLAPGRVSAATVTGNLTDISLEPLNTKLIFSPTNDVLVTRTGLSAGPPKVVDTINGQFSLALEAGEYTVSLPLVPWRRPFIIAVMETNVAVDITNLLAVPRAYNYTNPLPAEAPAGIPMLNGSGTNTALFNPTADQLNVQGALAWGGVAAGNGAGISNAPYLPSAGGTIGGSIDAAGLMAANLVVSSNLVLYPKDLACDMGNTRILIGTDDPLYLPDAISASVGTGGTTTAYVPNWVTQAVSTLTWQWSGSPTLYWTNTWRSYYWPAVGGRQIFRTDERPMLLTNHLTTVSVTNTWPATNALKAVTIIESYAQTNTSKHVFLIRWQLRLTGMPGVEEM